MVTAEPPYGLREEILMKLPRIRGGTRALHPRDQDRIDFRHYFGWNTYEEAFWDRLMIYEFVRDSGRRAKRCRLRFLQYVSEKADLVLAKQRRELIASHWATCLRDGARELLHRTQTQLDTLGRLEDLLDLHSGEAEELRPDPAPGRELQHPTDHIERLRQRMCDVQQELQLFFESVGGAGSLEERPRTDHAL